MRQPIESVLREIDSLPEARDTVTLKVPDKLSLRGSSVPEDIALSILIDRLLTKGYEPDSIEASDEGRIFRCKPVTAG
jgi:hypothetical protein